MCYVEFPKDFREDEHEVSELVEVLKPVLTEALTKYGFGVEAHFDFSRNAGCGCGCSPGFRGLDCLAGSRSGCTCQ